MHEPLAVGAGRSAADSHFVDHDDGDDFFGAGGENYFIGGIIFFQRDIAQFELAGHVQQFDDLGAGDAEEQAGGGRDPAIVFVDEGVGAGALNDFAIDEVDGFDGLWHALLGFDLGGDAGDVIDGFGFGQVAGLPHRGDGSALLVSRGGQKMQGRHHNKQARLSAGHKAVGAVAAGHDDADTGFVEDVAAQRFEYDIGELFDIPGASQLDQRR